MRISLVFLFTLAIIPMHSAFAQEDIAISAQITLRDSSDSLVTFLKIGKIAYVGTPILHTFLDGEFNPNTDPVFSANGQNIQIIRRAIDYHAESDELLTDLTLNANVDGQQYTLVRPIHYGIPVKQGDTLTVIWTFIRTR